MDSARCVEIFCVGGYGSGYALTGSLVLTARHVVCDSGELTRRDEIRVRLVANWKQGRFEKHTAEVVWVNKDHDLALLRVVDSNASWPNLAMPDFAAVVDEEQHPFEALGFPRFREEQISAAAAEGDNRNLGKLVGKTRDVFPASGTFRRSAKTVFLRLTIPSGTPRDPELWKGFSGAAIFSGGCLVGVISSVNPVVQGALDGFAVSTSLLNAEFLDKLQLTSKPPLKSIGVLGAQVPISKPKYADRLVARTTAELAELSSFFGMCTRITKDGTSRLVGLVELMSSFPFLTLSQHLNDGASPAWVRLHGARGAGKTTLLSALFSALDSPAVEERDRRKPFYLDARSFRLSVDPQTAINEAITEVEKRVRSGHSVLIVDGLSARDRGWSVKLCRQLEYRIPFRQIDAVIWTIADDFESSFEEITRELRQSVKPVLFDLVIESISSQDTRFTDFLRAFIKLHKRLIGEAETNAPDDILENFAQRVEDFSEAGEIDQHMLSLIYRSLQWAKYTAVKDIVVFMEMYCADRIVGDTFDRNISLDRTKQALQGPSWLAFRDVVENLYTEQSKIPPHFSISDGDRSGAAWSLISEHNNIRDFLAAWFAFDRLRSATQKASGEVARRDIVENDLLGYDFPQIINNLVRSLIEVKRETQQVLRNITNGLLAKLLKAEPPKPQTVNFICYLVGRLPNAPADLLEQVYSSVKERRTSESYLDRLQAKTQSRTISVSQMRLRMREKGNDFLRDLLKDSELASIDRGYHRLYYGDCVAFRDKVPQAYLDNAGSNWSKTFKKLRSSIIDELPELATGETAAQPDSASLGSGGLALQQEFQHKVITLLLFVQSRLGLTSQAERDRREFARRVVDRVLLRTGWDDEVRNYLEMMRIDLRDADPGKWRFILDLYRLKWEPRRGWLLRGLHPKFDVGRIESVAEHSYFVVLLATLMLPPQIEGLSCFSKEETIRVLTLHDIAEAYTGDIIFHKLSGESREKARRRESEVQHYLCWKQTYEGIYDTFWVHERLQSFTAAGIDKRAVDDNARIARDVDRLENLIQLHIYRDLYGDWITPDEFRSFAENLKMSMHPVMARLADDFVGWAERERGNIVQGHVEFFDADLVVSQDRVQKQAR